MAQNSSSYTDKTWTELWLDVRCILGMWMCSLGMDVLPSREKVELAQALHPLATIWRERAAKEITCIPEN